MEFAQIKFPLWDLHWSLLAIIIEKGKEIVKYMN